MILNSELNRLLKYQIVDKELIRAKKLHPAYPDNIFEKLAIITEESGEVAKAVLKYKYENGDFQNIKTELIQTAAMCIRMYESL
jgi:NTP pyrophosphatase (non-canonical NTP hydrolase)